MKTTTIKRVLQVSRPIVLGLAAAGIWSGNSMAFQFETADSDMSVRWDNTLKYNVGWRMDKRDRTLGDTWGMQAGEHKFDRGDTVTNRIDLLSEFDFIIKRHYGFRVSGAAWHDFAYDDKVEGNPAYQAAGLGTSYPGNKFTSDVKRYYRSGGELLDAFVFGRAYLGEMPLDVRFGRHNLYWGESLFSAIHGVSYSQGPVNFQKALATPGSEAKELFLPLNQVSAALQLTDNISIASQYQLEWEPYRLPEGGTYLSGSDLVFSGGTRTVTGTPYLGDLSSGRHATPDDRGNWGVSSKIATDVGNFGLYYRRFDDRVPGILFSDGALHNAYAEDVKLFGASFSTSINGVAVAGEIVRRNDTILNTVAGSSDLARGNTWHGLVNAVAFIGRTPFFDAAVFLGELTYSRLDEVTDNGAAFRHVDHNCPTRDKWVGCATDDAWGMQFKFTPTWYQAFPSADVTLPISFNRGLSGNSPVPFGGNEGSGSWSVGLGIDYKAKYQFDIAYTDYYGRHKTGANPFFGVVPGIGAGQLGSSNGNGAIHDRGWLSATFKTTF